MDQDSLDNSIARVGVFCGVCHRRNDGTSDFCVCRESLIGYRPLNSKEMHSSVISQIRERDAAGAPWDTEAIDVLRAWAAPDDSSHTTNKDSFDTRLWLPRFIAGIVFVTVGVAFAAAALALTKPEPADPVVVGAVVILGVFVGTAFATFAYRGTAVSVGKKDTGADGLDASHFAYLMWAIGVPIAVILSAIGWYLLSLA